MKKALDAFKETFVASLEAAKAADKAAAGKTAAEVAAAATRLLRLRKRLLRTNHNTRCPHFSIIGGAFVR